MRKFFLGLGLLLVLILIFPGKSIGLGDTVTNCTQPTPYIYQPTAGSTLTGSIVIEIYICPTVVTEMDVWAHISSSQKIFLGVADQTQGTYFQRWWNTGTVANGNYSLRAEAQIGDGTLRTFSPDVPVTVNNQTTPPGGTPTPTPKTKTPTPSTNIPTSQPTNTEEGTVVNAEGETTQTNVGNQVQVAAEPPKSEIPTATPLPTPAPSIDLVPGSQVLARQEFNLDRDKPLYLEKIEGRTASSQEKFLLFTGKSYSDSLVTMTVNSQPLVLTAKADSSGNWTYTLEKPLEPGKHEVYIEVNRDGPTEKSGPYPFSVAKAQASADNPTGSSLELVDPQKQALKTYLYIAAGLIGLAILIIAIYFYIKHIRSKAQTLLIKEP